jgi:hypothetical protein
MKLFGLMGKGKFGWREWYLPTGSYLDLVQQITDPRTKDDKLDGRDIRGIREERECPH